jgi:hypothetical protein
MAGERMRAGWEGRVAVIVYDSLGAPLYSIKYLAVKKWSMKARAPTLNADNTEGKPGRAGGTLAPGFQSRLPNIRGCDVRLEQTTYDDSADPFSANPAGAGYSLREGAYAKVVIWPNRNDAPDTAKAHTVENMQITEIEWAGEVGQSQPVTIVGESDGLYNFT